MKHIRPVSRVVIAVLGAIVASWSIFMLWIGLAGEGWRDWWREFNPLYLGLYGLLLVGSVWVILRAFSRR